VNSFIGQSKTKDGEYIFFGFFHHAIANMLNAEEINGTKVTTDRNFTFSSKYL